MSLPQDEPVVMVNLLKFKGGRRRGQLPALRRGKPSHLARVGASVVWGGHSAVILGDGAKPWWDAILLVGTPTPGAFLEMVADPAYHEVHEHRAAALDRGDLIATAAWALAAAIKLSQRHGSGIRLGHNRTSVCRTGSAHSARHSRVRAPGVSVIAVPDSSRRARSRRIVSTISPNMAPSSTSLRCNVFGCMLRCSAIDGR